MYRLASILFALICIALAACGRAQPAALTPADDLLPHIAVASNLAEAGRGPAVQPGQPAPDFFYQLPDGATHSLAELRGRPVLLNFWATWCLPCREEMPALQAALASYGEQDLAVVGVSVEAPDTISAFARELQVTFPLIANQSADIVERYSVPALPTTFFIDRDGIVRARHLGALDVELIRSQLEAIP